MKSYSESHVFDRTELLYLKRAQGLVEKMPEMPKLRCHEVARAVGKVLDLPVQDGKYGMVDHSWLWLRQPPRDYVLSEGEAPRLSELPPILDVYCVGSLPQVRLLDTSSLLPHTGFAYRPGPLRKDIDERLVTELVRAITK